MRKLPAPWSAEKTDGGYRVRDNSGRTLCYIYCRDDEKNADVANVLTWEEGRRIAAKIAMLPTLLKKPLVWGSALAGRDQSDSTRARS